MVYYNEHDPFAAAWLRELIAAGHIAFGVVDERSIEDVLPSEVMQFKQCHWFAGVGVWSYALRRAGWADDRPVWTGSCPCQPFSAAGKGDGFADERHLWPAFYHLIAQCKPAKIFGEQVASKAVDAWIDLVHADLEAVGYAFGSVPFPSAGIGAPHIRDRNFWVADSTMRGHDSRYGGKSCGTEAAVHRQAREGYGAVDVNSGTTRRVGDNNNTRLEGFGRGHQAEGGRVGAVGSVTQTGELGGMADAGLPQCESQPNVGTAGILGASVQQAEQRDVSSGMGATSRGAPEPSPTNGFWRDADWLFCRDGKWRPVRPGTFPLAHGAPARVGRLRGYGNAINAEAATAFIESCMTL